VRLKIKFSKAKKISMVLMKNLEDNGFIFQKNKVRILKRKKILGGH
jgi:hypothetical protein